MRYLVANIPRTHNEGKCVSEYPCHSIVSISLHYLVAPASPPVDIVTNKINSTAINIKFGLINLSDRNGIIDKYQVKIRQKDVDTNWTSYFVTENGATKTIVIGGLEKWRDYEYVVSGCTIGGCGENSTIAIQRTDQDSTY